MAKNKNIEAAVSSLIKPTAQQMQLDLWDIRFVKEGSEHYLRITIDKPLGISIDDCENFSRAIEPIIDESDPIDCSYYLEVSSPGLGRPLTRPEHFEKLMGKEVQIKLFAAKNGNKEFTGLLCGYDGSVTIESEGEKVTFPKQEISSVKLNDDKDLF